MYKLLLVLGFAAAACEPSKKSEIGQSITGGEDKMVTTDSALTGIPSCMQKMIDSFKTVPKHEQPQKVMQYRYKGKLVYYVNAHCCDFFNALYDSNCNLMGYPDGGFTGKGDGKFPDFAKSVTEEKVIWENK